MYSPGDSLIERVNNIFTYHPPTADQVESYTRIRNIARDFASILIHLTPESREQSLAITKLQEVVMFANAAIAINTTK